MLLSNTRRPVCSVVFDTGRPPCCAVSDTGGPLCCHLTQGGLYALLFLTQGGLRAVLYLTAGGGGGDEGLYIKLYQIQEGLNSVVSDRGSHVFSGCV